MKNLLTTAYEEINADMETLRMIQNTRRTKKLDDPADYVCLNDIFVVYLRQKNAGTLQWIYKKGPSPASNGQYYWVKVT
jgi:hypothetical protein